MIINKFLRPIISINTHLNSIANISMYVGDRWIIIGSF